MSNIVTNIFGSVRYRQLLAGTVAAIITTALANWAWNVQFLDPVGCIFVAGLVLGSLSNDVFRFLRNEYE